MPWRPEDIYRRYSTCNPSSSTSSLLCPVNIVYIFSLPCIMEPSADQLILCSLSGGNGIIICVALFPCRMPTSVFHCCCLVSGYQRAISTPLPGYLTPIYRQSKSCARLTTSSWSSRETKMCPRWVGRGMFGGNHLGFVEVWAMAVKGNII